jgi:hypothetical protein
MFGILPYREKRRTVGAALEERLNGESSTAPPGEVR